MIEAAYFREGESRSAAPAAAHCGLEQALLTAISKELSQGESIRAHRDPTAKEMEYGDTVTVKLFISAAISEAYDRLERQYEKVDEASEAPRGGCVQLTKLVQAKVLTRRFAISSHQDHDASIRGRITRDTTWSWELTANREGKNIVVLELGHVLPRGGEELKPVWLDPPLHATITIKAEPLAKASNPVERNSRWLLPVGIVLTVAATLLVGMLRKREQRRQSEPGDEG
jgi:hypothetical protein